MSDSNITKKALARSLKELIHQHPFEKISVGEICENCELNRKSFYYHFKDKYDLVEWIFYTEFITAIGQADIEGQWSFLQALCAYFYAQRDFYAKILRVSGQNAFQKYFADYLFQMMEPFLRMEDEEKPVDDEENYHFYITFLRDAMLVSVVRWLTEGAQIPPEQFIQRLQYIAQRLEAQPHALSDAPRDSE